MPVGFEQIRTRFEIDAPGTTAEQMARLRDTTERYCVAYQTLARPGALLTEWTLDSV